MTSVSTGLKHLKQLISTATPNECVLWDRCKTDGYGTYRDKHKTYRVHRVSLEISIGRTLQPHEFACHHCDTPACVNPHHLWIGTHADNLEDMTAKGRRVRGTKVGNSKLTESDVIRIRQSSLSQRAIAKEFNISQSSVSLIKAHINWR